MQEKHENEWHNPQEIKRIQELMNKYNAQGQLTVEERKEFKELFDKV